MVVIIIKKNSCYTTFLCGQALQKQRKKAALCERDSRPHDERIVNRDYTFQVAE